MPNIVPLNAKLPVGASKKSYSKTLCDALEDPVKIVTGEHGVETRPLPWVAPSVVSPALKRDAAAALEALREASGPVEQEDAERWVAHLANSCAGKELPPESKLAGTVSSILRCGYPAVLFGTSERGLDVFDRMARKFTWWPGWAELAPALDSERSALRAEFERLQVLARGGMGKPEEQEDRPTGPRTLSEASLAALARMRISTDGPEPLVRRNA